MYYLRALHIIFIVTWFAGLFYIVRLFIYQREAQDKEEAEQKILSAQFKIMSKRLWYGITWPSMILTLIFGLSLLLPNWSEYRLQTWMHIKLSFLVLLFGYHFWCHKIFKQQQKDVYLWSSNQLRIWNEVATLFLVAIVFLVKVQNQFNWIYGVAGFFAFGLLIMIAIKVYKGLRKK